MSVLSFTFCLVSILCESGFTKEQITNCGEGQHWVRAHHRRAYVRADGTQVSAADVSAHCKTYTIRGRSENKFVKPDGMDSPAEDFSNNIESYLFNPKTLEKITPGAYKWIQQKFGDKMQLHSGSKS